MDNTILGQCDVEELTKDNLLNLYSLVINECRNRNLKDGNGKFI